jgi:ketosteroid isomerase-like protein
MTTQDVANHLVQLCNQGKFMDAMQELYSKDIISVEAMAGPDGVKEVRGIGLVAKKGEWWSANHEVHGIHIEGPMVAGSHFCVRFKMDVTNKPSGKRMTMDELAVYQVKDGKIIREEFFYGM